MKKTCSICEDEKHSDEFPEGRRQCKLCLNRRSQERYATPEGKAARKKTNARWYEKIKSTEEYQETRNQWREANPDRIRAARLLRYANDPEATAKSRTKHQHFRQAHPEYDQTYFQVRLTTHRERLHALKSAPCLDCGEPFLPCAMDYDHVRGEKRHAIADMVGRFSWEQVEVEIAKCDLVCANCHRMRTALRRPTTEDPARGWFRSLKSRPCSDCGRTFPPEVMDFDHVRGEKVAGLARVRNPEQALDEAQKCDLVCACCHRVRTYGEETCQIQPTKIRLNLLNPMRATV